MREILFNLFFEKTDFCVSKLEKRVQSPVYINLFPKRKAIIKKRNLNLLGNLEGLNVRERMLTY